MNSHIEGTMLSKSRYISGLQCHKKLWFDVHDRDLAPPPNESLQAIFDAGHRVGELAQQRWPGGVVVDTPPWKRMEAIAETKALMSDPDVNVIYEGGIGHAGVLTRADVLVRDPGTDAWTLVEVKRSTKAKDVFVNDVAVQSWIIKGAGINLRQAGLLLLNRDYVYDGETLDLQELFRFVDLTEEAQEQAIQVGAEVTRQHKVVSRDAAPDIAVGAHCSAPYECPYWAHCWRGIEEADNPLSLLPRFSTAKQEALRESGIEELEDLPDNVTLSAAQERVRDCTLSGQPWVSDGINDAFAELEWPVSYLDFEAAQFDVPRYKGTSPFRATAFQFSCHKQLIAGGELEHVEFLADGHVDPRPELAESLLEAVGDKGSIIVYSAYEKTTINALAVAVPKLAEKLRALIPRLFDLLQVVSRHYYHPDFRGSYSIKKVLPVLVPTLGYDDLDIADGQSAANAWIESIDMSDADQRALIRSNLLAYCALDSIAMVRLHEALVVAAAE